MSVVPGSIETDRQPPMTIPLRHFLLAQVLLVAGVVAGIADAMGQVAGFATAAQLHLLLAGWVCVTIMGAMTQFVPVWSGVELHSRRFAAAQLWLVLLGLAGFATGLLTARIELLLPFGTVMALGFWTFVYNVGRTLADARPLDVTERHFAIALGFFLLVTGFGILLALSLRRPVFADLPVARADAVAAHATLAVFGAVLTTVFGALYQLATMFTQTELHGVDLHLQRFEAAGYPLGVLALAGGRLFAIEWLALAGGLVVLASVLAVAAILARRLLETTVPWTPMLSRYAVAVPAFGLWAILTVPVWVADPLAADATLGAPGTDLLLTMGGIGFVVFGTLYHVVPFVIWVHRYSDLLGFEDVPMIDDLYDDRIARIDLLFLVAGVLGLVAGDLAALEPRVLATGGIALGVGVLAFGWNLLAVIRRHGPHSLPEILFSIGGAGGRTDGERTAEEVTDA